MALSFASPGQSMRRYRWTRWGRRLCGDDVRRFAETQINIADVAPAIFSSEITTPTAHRFQRRRRLRPEKRW